MVFKLYLRYRVKKNRNMSKYIYAIATLSGTIIGVGFFSLPYITLKTGISAMLIYFLVLAGLVALIHYLFGQVALKTPDFLRLAGYAKIYLGKWGERTALMSEIIGSLGAILAYIVVGGEFLGRLLNPFFGGSAFFYSILYFILGAVFILWGIKAIAKIEFWGLLLIFGSLIFIFWQGLPFFKIGNLFLKTGPVDFFLPYGPILFSLWGLSLIPEIEEMLGRDKKMLKKVIIAGISIPALVYLAFIVLTLGISGASTSPEAISGLGVSLGTNILGVAFFAGVLATFTSFITVGLTLKKVFWYDLKLPKLISWLAVCLPPLILFLWGVNNFIRIIGFVGSITGAISGILILLMYQKIKKTKYGFLNYFLILIFAAGIIYEVIYSLF